MGTDDRSYRFYPGDPKFRDRNGDGKVDMGDKTVNNPGDLYVVGNTSARFPFSLDLSGEWKGIDLRIFLQGLGKEIGTREPEQFTSGACMHNHGLT